MLSKPKILTPFINFNKKMNPFKSKSKKTKENNEKSLQILPSSSTSNDKQDKKSKRLIIAPAGGSSAILDFPEDVVSWIFAFLSAEDLLLGASIVCKKWRDIIVSERVYCLSPWIFKSNISQNGRFRSEGRDLFDKKLWKESISAFSKAIILNPRDHLAYFWRAYAYDENGQYDLAVKDFSKSLEFEPSDATAYSNRGATYRDMGSLEKALIDLKRALAMDPNSAPVHNNVGVVLGDMGLYEEAIREYTRALEIDPHHIVALRNRARRYEKMERFKEAKEDFDKVILMNPKDAVALRFFKSQKKLSKSPRAPSSVPAS